MTTAAQDMREPDLRCITASCPQWSTDLTDTCGCPDPEVCTGNEEKGLDPCPDRKV